MKTLVVSGIQNVTRIELSGDNVVLQYAEPVTEVKHADISASITAQDLGRRGGNADTEAQKLARRINMAKATAARVEMRAAAAKELGSMGGSQNTAKQNSTRALNLIAARAGRARKRAERNSKSSSQIENEAAKEIIGHLFNVAKRNEEAKNA